MNKTIDLNLDDLDLIIICGLGEMVLNNRVVLIYEWLGKEYNEMIVSGFFGRYSTTQRGVDLISFVSDGTTYFPTAG